MLLNPDLFLHAIQYKNTLLYRVVHTKAFAVCIYYNERHKS